MLAVADFGQAGGKAASFAEFVFSFDGGFFSFPVDAEGRIGDAIAEGKAFELVIGKGVAILHVVGFAAADDGIGFGDGIGGGIDFLPKALDFDIAIEFVDAFLHAGEHLPRAHGHVVDGDEFAVEFFAGEKQVGHEVDDIAAGKVFPRAIVNGFGETADEFFEDVTAIDGADFIGAEVAFFTVEFFNHEVKRIVFDQAFNHIVKFKFGEDVLYIGREARQVVAEVGFNVVGIRQEGGKSKFARIVKVVAGFFAKKAVNDGEVFLFFVFGKDGVMGGQKTVVKTFDDGHGQDDAAVFMRLEGASDDVGHVPDEGGFLLDIDSHRFDFIVYHVVPP